MSLAEDVNIEEFVMTKDELSGADVKVFAFALFAPLSALRFTLPLLSRGPSFFSLLALTHSLTHSLTLSLSSSLFAPVRPCVRRLVSLHCVSVE